jgi:glycosyltransferase involved in cell wall biosynthesis
MKICLLTYRGNPYCGGQGVYVSYLGRELARQGHEVHGISGPPYPDDVPGVTWHRVPGLLLYGGHDTFPPANRPLAAFNPLNLYSWAATRLGGFPEMTVFSVRAFRKVRQLLRQHHFDVLHDNQTLAWGLLPLRELGVPLLATIHHPLSIDLQRGFDPPTSFSKQFDRVRFYPVFMQRVVARRMARVVTVSEASARAIRRDFGVAAERIEVIYNGVDAEQFRPFPEIRPVPGRVLFVGNIEDPNKGGRYLLRAMTRVRPEAHLVIVTGGIWDRPALDRELDSLGIRHRVTCYQQLSRDDLIRMYATAEVAVSPSVFEGFGFPAAEAMACGLPLVAAAGGALPEVVGDAGIVVPARDPWALAEAINVLLGDAALRQHLGRAARQRVRKCFRWEDAARRLAQVYRETIDAYR